MKNKYFILEIIKNNSRVKSCMKVGINRKIKSIYLTNNFKREYLVKNFIVLKYIKNANVTKKYENSKNDKLRINFYIKQRIEGRYNIVRVI